MSQDYSKELFLSGFAMGYSNRIENKDDAKLIYEAGEALCKLVEIVESCEKCVEYKHKVSHKIFCFIKQIEIQEKGLHCLFKDLAERYYALPVKEFYETFDRLV